ncbi:ARM repeat-containing protein [Wilcoxina mikolae CBS 423.85]|nr:ARM repeat-containing protein [Wilcoxina mikolae CBS 423.85]
MAQVPDEAKELRLVNNVELKIALADTDAQLQKLLNLYLAPLLMKLGSPHSSVRNKVIAVCSHVNTRIKPSNLRLPVPALLEQFKDPAVGGTYPLIRNFDLMYITTGIDRMPVSERLELLPTLVRDISKHGNDHHQGTLFNVLLRLQQHFVPPPRGSEEDTALRENLFRDGVQDAEWLAGWFVKLMLLNLNIFSQEDKSCPGLSAADIEFLTLGKKETFIPTSMLAEAKVAALKFLASGAFMDREQYLAALIASTDTNSAVADPADDIFKRSIATVSLEDEGVVGELYTLLLGRPGIPPAKLTLQTKIIGLLSKSRKATEEVRKGEIEAILTLGLETTYPRLRQAVFSFMTWVSRMADDGLTNTLAPGVVEKLRYWLLSDPTASDEVRGYAYETLALLASRCIYILLEPELDIIRFLFRQLKDDKGGVAVSIEGALGVVLTKIAREKLDQPVKAALETMLLDVIVQENRGVGQAVKWAGRLLGFGSVVGRWVGALSVEMGGTTAEEGAKAIHPYYYRLVNPEASIQAIKNVESQMDVDVLPAEDKFAFPQFAPLVLYFFSVNHILPASFAGNLIAERLPPKSFAAALAFAKRIAIWEALGPQQLDIKIDEDWDRNVDTVIGMDELARSRVETFFEQQEPSVLATLLDVAWEGMIYDGEGVDQIRNIWNDLAALVPPSVLERYTGNVSVVWKLLNAPKAETRRVVAYAVGLLGSFPNVADPTLSRLVDDLVAGIEENKSGAFLGFGFLLSRLKMRGRLDSVNPDLVRKGIEMIATTLAESRDAALVETAIEAIRESAVFNVVDESMIDVEKVQKSLLEKAKRGHEKSVQTLGYLSFLYPEESPQAENIIVELIKLGESGGVEMSFVAGEALANASAGWGSSAVRRGRSVAGVQRTVVRRTGVKKLLSQFLKRANEAGGGGKRRTTVVGLLSVVEFCNEDEAVKERLSDAQQAFRAFLTDRDDFIQETAARGLTAVYSLSDEDTQRDLVRSLVSSFTGETKQKIQVSRDTQLFEPGQLPTGDGSSVGSYGDIMSLAAELGDPSLVYKFMTLARHNSTWASRAAFGRFGLGKILSNSAEVRDNEKLWPVLYRYRFDPSTGVRQSMGSIWQALGGCSETVERWWEAILQECLKGAVRGSEWRVREASISAMTDLLGGRKVSQYKPYLQDIWAIAFKVLDDVKESVRIAAMKLCKVLTAGMVRAVEGDTGPKENMEILSILMEFLMGRQGLEAEAKDVQLFALSTLLQVVKSAGEKLRPWIPELVQKMLVLLADVEPEAVNYLIMNADKYGTTGEDIDRMRLNSIRSSPIMSTIEDILDNLDAPTIAKLIPSLTKAIRTSLSLPSKIGCSRVVVSLVMRHPTLFRPYADDIGKSLLGAVKDRSEVVSLSYAVAAGYACRLATDKGILQTVDWCKKNYWAGEERERRASGAVLGAVYKHATDRANALAVDILPFIFIAKGDTDESVSEEFSKTWTENTGGSGAIKLYLKEIVQISTENLTSARWSTRQTCAFALAAAVISMSRDITEAQIQVLWPALISATSGKSWDGKEKVLEAFVSLAVDAKQYLQSDEVRMKEIELVVLREAMRNNVAYRGPAIKCLGMFADGFENLDLFGKVYEIVESAIAPFDEDEMDVDGEDGKSAKQLQQGVIVKGLKASSQAFRPSVNSNEEAGIQQISQLLDIFDKHIVGANLELKTCSIESITLVVERLVASNLKLENDAWTNILRRIWLRILDHSNDRGFENGRTKAAAALGIFLDCLTRHKTVINSPECRDLVEMIRKGIGQTVKDEKSAMVLRVLDPIAARLLQV